MGTDLEGVVEHTFGYNGGPLAMLSEDTAVYECGNGLLFASTAGDGQDWEWNRGLSGLSAFAINAKAG